MRCLPVGFCLIHLMGFDLLTGVFTLVPLARSTKRPGVTVSSMLRNWDWVFVGNLTGAMPIGFTTGSSASPDLVGERLGTIGQARTVGYAAAAPPAC